MMRRTLAASYCDLSVAEFEREIAAGRLPMPLRLGRGERWHKQKLDHALDSLSGDDANDWRRKLGLLPEAPNGLRFAERVGDQRDSETEAEPEKRLRAFKVSTLAAHWKCSEAAVRSLIDKGELMAFRVGRLMRISPEAVEAF